MYFLFILWISLFNVTPVETLPKISIKDVTKQEGNKGINAVKIKISLNKTSPKTITVVYNTVEGTAKANEDFITATNKSLNFKPGQKEKTITVLIQGDKVKEGDDQFTINFSAQTNALVEKNTATITILNDDTKVGFSNTGYDAPVTYEGYNLAWADEFNGSQLNSKDWTHQNGDGCPTLCGWGNNELQFYTDRKDNLFFQDGKLVIEAKKEAMQGKEFTSSKIVTSLKKAFKYGRVDIRAILPKGKGIWPALWMLPQTNKYGGWPMSGEIDIMEMIGHEANKVHGTLHYGEAWPKNAQKGGNFTLTTGLFNDAFHVFSIEWKEDQIKWFIDGNLYATVNKADMGAAHYPFNEDFYFIFNLAVGGNWPGNPDANTYLPQWLIVDYIRVYQ
jgi:beta-glucanase (GH16 family)